MKTYSGTILFTLFLFFYSNISAQDKQINPVNESIRVWGNCEMCKKTIEKAAVKAGATKANWDTETKILAVSYDPGKSSTRDIQKAIAAAGYDTKDFEATEKAYSSLPHCCQYERKKETVNGNSQTSFSVDKKAAGTDSKDCCNEMNCCSNGGDCKKSDGNACCQAGKAGSDQATCKEKGQCTAGGSCCKS